MNDIEEKLKRLKMDDIEEKLQRLKNGERVVTNDAELDAMLALGDEAIYQVRSIPNPDRLGLLDKYLSWIGDNIV